MRFNNIAIALIILGLVTGCSTVPVPTAKQAAVLDTATTAAVLATKTGYEANPVGFIGATLIKVLILSYIDKFEPETQDFVKKATATLWTAAAVNNIAVLVGVAAPVSYPITLAAGYAVYVNTPTFNKTKNND
jgi:hypothetical protein